MLRQKRVDISISNKTFAIFFVAFACAAWFTAKFFPGFMSFDSLQQYRQTIGVIPLSDAHPVIMVYVWRALLNVVNNPGVMLAFHQFFYWSAIAVFSTVAASSFRLRLLLFFMVGLCPPLIITSLHLWKDVGMMSSLALATAALLADIRKPHWMWSLVVLASLFYAIAVRINGFIPAIPLLIFLCYRLVSQRGYSRPRILGMTSLLVMLLCLGQYFAMKIVNSEARRSYGLGTLVVWDMVAISLAENENLLPSYLPRSTKGELLPQLKETFNPEANYPSYAVVSPYPPEDRQDQLVKDWLALVVQHPIPYLKHRLHVLKVLLGIGRKEIYYPFHPGIDSNEFGFTFTSMSSEEVQGGIKLFGKLAESIIYRPWVYLLLALAVFSMSAVRLAKNGMDLDDLLSATVALSGLASAGSLFVIATAADYRYITWMIFSALLSAVILSMNIRRES